MKSSSSCKCYVKNSECSLFCFVIFFFVPIYSSGTWISCRVCKDNEPSCKDTWCSSGRIQCADKQKWKLCKPVVRTSKQWTSEAVEELKACLDCTDWNIFRSATNRLDEYTEAVTSYINFCQRTTVSYNNDKPWFTAKLRQLRQTKEDVFRDGNRKSFKKAE